VSVHLEARPGDIAQTVLLPGDPLRAKYIAETFLEDSRCYNEVRGMFGFTGTYKGKRISVQGTGMGVPSASIYAHELIYDYEAQTLIRVGTCGALERNIHVRDVIIAQAACYDSMILTSIPFGVTFTPVADFELLKRAYDYATENHLSVRVGNTYTSDRFYNDSPDTQSRLADLGVLAVEMETAALYALAAQAKIRALSVLTVSDHVITGESTTPLERQTSFDDMIRVALAAVVE